MTYLEAIRYLESLVNYEKIPAWSYKESLKLKRFKGFLKLIGNPHHSLKCIHIAGTKGKGSTSAFCAYILREAGYNTGLYTSPHLSDFRERIRILPRKVIKTKSHRPQGMFEGVIAKRDLADLVHRLKPAIELYNENSIYGQLSFFEVYTALAFVYFKEKNTDFVVLETGLGGRLDATNVVNPLVCALTHINYDHTDKLGHTLKKIAAEKAGIIKRQKAKGKRQNLIVISAPQEKEVIQVIRQRCKKVGAELYVVGEDITYHKTKNGFIVKGILGAYTNLRIRLLGQHQIINAAVATGVIEALNRIMATPVSMHNRGNINICHIRRGLYNTVWPGRCEIISKNPLIVLDGAQNISSCKVIKETVRQGFKYDKLILVLGVSRDKDIKGICNQLYDLADEIILTRADNPRAYPPQELAKYFSGKNTYKTHTVQEARGLALSLAKKDDLILVCGSLFVVGEFRDA